MWELSGTREKMLAGIASHAQEKEVRIKTKPSKKIFFLLLEKTAVRKINMSHGIAKTVTKSVFEGLRNAHVEVREVGLKRGRPAKFSAGKRKDALGALKKGMNTDEVSRKFGVSRRMLFYWKKMKKKN